MRLLFGLMFGLLVCGATGCTTYTTPDGQSFSSWTGTARVREELGKPDLVVEDDHGSAWGMWHSTDYAYFNRGYEVHFADGSVKGVWLIDEPRRQDIERLGKPYHEPNSKGN